MEARKYDVPEMEQMMTDPDCAATSDVDRYRNFVPDVHFELIPIKNLVSNQQYQRKLSMRHVESAAAEFNIFEINPVKVSRRDGINYPKQKSTIKSIAQRSDVFNGFTLFHDICWYLGRGS